MSTVTLNPLMPLWLSIPLFGLLLVPCIVLLVLRPRQRVDWLRRVLMVLLLAVVALRPITPLEGEQTQRMDANVFFVVDRTGSMNAEDYGPEKQARLDGVKEDMRRIMSMTEGARYSIIAFDSVAASQLPLTTDAGAAMAWVDTLTTEPTAYSQGSNIDRPLVSLVGALEEAQQEDPDSHRLVYFLSDGENTDGRDAESFGPAHSLVDGGGVLGYGTAEGGRMKIQGGEDHGDYITDSSGAEGVSTIDEAQLEKVAEDLGVPYLHRTDPEASIDGTMDGITLKPVPHESSRDVPTFDDWYWVASIPLAALFIWELGALTYRLPRRLEREEIRGAIR